MEATKGSGILTIKGSSAGLTVDLTGAADAVSGFTAIGMTTEGSGDKVKLTSDQIGTEGYTSFRGTLTENSVDDSVVVSAGSTNTAKLDLSSVTSSNVVFDVSKFDTLATLTLGRGNSALVSKGQIANTVAETPTLTITGDTTSPSVVRVDDQLVGTAYSTTLAGYSTAEPAYGADTSFGEVITDQSKVFQDVKEIAGVKYSLSDSADSVRLTGGSGGYLDAGAGNDYVKHVEGTSSLTLVGGDGADFIQGGGLMFAGSETTLADGVYAESTDNNVSGASVVAECMFLGKGDGGWEGNSYQKALFNDHNVLNPIDGVGATSSAHPVVVLSDKADTVLIQGATNDQAQSYSIHQFTLGTDAILYFARDTTGTASGSTQDQGGRQWTCSTAELKAVNGAAITIDTNAHTVAINWEALQSNLGDDNEETTDFAAKSYDMNSRIAYSESTWNSSQSAGTDNVTTFTFMGSDDMFTALTTEAAAESFVSQLFGGAADDIEVVGTYKSNNSGSITWENAESGD